MKNIFNKNKIEIIDKTWKDKHKNEWRKVLLEIYKDNWQIYEVIDLNEEHPLVKSLKISVRSTQKAISFLNEQKLIYIQGKDNLIFLTEKGFNIARDLQKEISNAFQQATIIFLTFVLALTSLFDFIYRSQNSKSLFIWYVVSLLLAMGITAYIFKRSIK